MAKVISIKTRKIVEETTTAPVVVKEETPVSKASILAAVGKVVGLVAMIAGVTSYLVYQNYSFFDAIIKGAATITICGLSLSVPALMNSVVAELVLLTAAAFTSSRSWGTKIIAWVLTVGMIYGLGMFMHASLDNDLTGSSDYVTSLKQQKEDAVKAKEGYEADKATLDPETWKTRREATQVKIDVERANIVALDQKISESKSVASSNLSSIIIYNTLLRITAMIVNALLAHTLVASPKRKTYNTKANKKAMMKLLNAAAKLREEAEEMRA